MQPDLLQQLRDIHMPAEPLWWPAAPGWWLLALLVIACCVFTVRQVWQFSRRRRPIRRARSLYQALHVRLQNGEIAPATYVHESNELLKRLLIHGLGMHAARPATDRAWLYLLDECFGSPEFSNGPGQILGNERFRQTPEIQIEPLHALLSRFLSKVRP